MVVGYLRSAVSSSNIYFGILNNPSNSLTYLSWFVLEGLITGDVDQNAIYWLWLPSLVIIDISCASTALHMLVSDLRRSSTALLSSSGCSSLAVYSGSGCPLNDSR